MAGLAAWSVVESWRAQAERNHGQTLERLNERGGLAPEELWLAAHGLGFASAAGSPSAPPASGCGR